MMMSTMALKFPKHYFTGLEGTSITLVRIVKWVRRVPRKIQKKQSIRPSNCFHEQNKIARLLSICVTQLSVSDNNPDWQVFSIKKYLTSPVKCVGSSRINNNQFVEGMENSIQELIGRLFSSKSEEKRITWVAAFADQEYNTLDELQGMDEEDWSRLEKKLPGLVYSSVQKELRKINGQDQPNKVKDNQEQKTKKTEREKKEETKEEKEKKEMPHQFSSQEMGTIITYISRDMTPVQIARLMMAAPGSLYEEAIFQKINAILKPPSPPPTNRKKVTPRQTQNPMLDLYLYQGKQILTRKYYTFITLGETGSGKTTLLDAFVNYLNGMEYKDNWRWRLVDESNLNQKSNGKSKTSEISIYYINDVHNRFNIRIIDSPGFGDTEGMKVDNKITDKFEKLFKEISQIDYILLTVKASETRDMAGTRYVFNRIQQLFGINAKSHFVLMCTFADGTVPPCLEIISKEFTFEKYFKFNNSALYTPSNLGDESTIFFWRLAMSSVKLFADYVIKAERDPLSLQLSGQVLETRKYLQASIQTSQKAYDEAFLELNVTTESFVELQKNKKKIENNESYTENRSYVVPEENPLSKTYQMCTVCQVTCCQICAWPDGVSQSPCSYFNGGKKCPICPGKCAKFFHKQTMKQIINVTKYKTQVVNWKKDYYNQGLSGAQIYLKIFKEKKDKIIKLTEDIWKRSEEIKQILKELQQTALKPKIFSDVDFYNQMIEAEETGRKEGWMDRVVQIKMVIKNLQKLENMQKSKTIHDLIPGLKNFEEQVRAVENGEQAKGGACHIY